MDLFADQRNTDKEAPGQSKSKEQHKPWTILLVDDDYQMHQITQLALNGFEFRGRKLELISAYSGEEAKKIFQEREGIALALVDVVMETDHAGLDLIKYIRNDLKNRMTRLVLRTGQAGQAPEDLVIQEYEIDDYKEKTELTTQKLRTLLYSMLRSYLDLCIIEEQKKGLSQVIEASANVQNTNTLKTYATAVLGQVTSLLNLEASAFYCVVPASQDESERRALTLAATGEYVECYPKFSLDLLPELVAERCQKVLDEKETMYYSDACIFYSFNDRGISSLLYINLNADLTDLERQLLDIYMQNISLTFENLNLMIDLQETSKELVYSLANAVEARSKETGTHVQRVATMSEMLGRYYGLPEQEVTMIKHASPLHDIGKVAVPDHILHKPGKLDNGEWAEMQKHVEYGIDILKSSKRELIVLAREIATFHHEKWDGTGYPNQLSGEDIPVAGRITALADVFDALGSLRCYKDRWSDEEIKKEITSQRGKHFQPELVDIMLENWDEFVAVREMYPD
ncbi:DUF3369 domain-containing protein [Vibrio sp. JC009]|uniref:DUF3369 domain-containing protein n=1 Tax=Vibrio sp. JC009 TaxID=2912314 RepID=UPI0023AFC139|nr:DUF3369 domain-containing protein [Vibrio sp. JC009]WED24921.1 DUF3369 domain-containing protein [Vibrio sp. JC009]